MLALPPHLPVVQTSLARRALQVWNAAWFSRHAPAYPQQRLAAYRLAQFRHDPSPRIQAIARDAAANPHSIIDGGAA